MSARTPAVVAGFAAATFEQFGSSEIGTPADCMTWHQAPQRILWRAERAAAICGTFGREARSLCRKTQGQVHQGLAATTHPWCLERPGGQTQPNLEYIAERTVAESESVVDGQGGELDGGCFGGAAQQSGFVLLCALQGAAPHRDGARYVWPVLCAAVLLACRCFVS